MTTLEVERFRVPPGARIRLDEIDSDASEQFDDDRETIEAERVSDLKARRDLHERLRAEKRRALLVVFMAIDTGGKDSTIDRVFSGLNPQGCLVVSFAAPTDDELAHDFLWRVHQRTPRAGQIGIFNRSHYEDVTVARVRGLVERAVWEQRYEHVLAFERLLLDSGVALLKFHLRISREEQAARLRDRLEDPSKHWKFDPRDLEERKRWDDYQASFEDAINATSTAEAPWWVIPANSKWYRDALVTRVVVNRLREMKSKRPPPVSGIEQYRVE